MTTLLPKPLGAFAQRLFLKSWFAQGFTQPPGELLKAGSALVRVHNIGVRASIDGVRETTTATIAMIRNMKRHNLTDGDIAHNETCEEIVKKLLAFEHLTNV